jgi:hypothetical protein
MLKESNRTFYKMEDEVRINRHMKDYRFKIELPYFIEYLIKTYRTHNTKKIGIKSLSLIGQIIDTNFRTFFMRQS